MEPDELEPRLAVEVHCSKNLQGLGQKKERPQASELAVASTWALKEEHLSRLTFCNLRKRLVSPT